MLFRGSTLAVVLGAILLFGGCSSEDDSPGNEPGDQTESDASSAGDTDPSSEDGDADDSPEADGTTSSDATDVDDSADDGDGEPSDAENREDASDLNEDGILDDTRDTNPTSDAGESTDVDDASGGETSTDAGVDGCRESSPRAAPAVLQQISVRQTAIAQTVMSVGILTSRPNALPVIRV
jgi:hypothetical protein